MAKKTKEKSLDSFYLNQETKKNNSRTNKKRSNVKNVKKKSKVNEKIKNQTKEKNTKDEKFNFDEEIIIGLKRIDEDKNSKSKTLQTKNDNKNKIKQKKNVKNKQVNSKKQPVNDQPNKKEINTQKQNIINKKRKAILRLIKWTSLIIIIIGGVIYALLSPMFNIKTINVVGNSKISSDEIISLSKIELEKNMFQHSKKEIIKNIKENAYIEDVQVKRKIPDTIEVIITERKATFKFQIANAYAVINNQGYILKVSDKTDDLPIIVGIETPQENIQTGNRLCEEDLKKMGDVLKIMESANSNDVANLITKIDITDHNNYKLILQKKNKTVHLGDTSNLSTKMLWIIEFNEIEGNTKGEIMLNMNLNDEKSKPYFRKGI